VIEVVIKYRGNMAFVVFLWIVFSWHLKPPLVEKSMFLVLLCFGGLGIKITP